VRRPPTPAFALAGILVAAAALFTLHQVLHLRVHYYDTYDYLNDARALLGVEGAGYYDVHAPLVPALLTPAAWIGMQPPADDPLGWILPHGTSAVLNGLVLLAVFGWLRQRFGSRWALVGVALFVCSRPFVRFAPHVMVDLAAAGGVAAAFWLQERRRIVKGARAELGFAVLLGLSLAAALLTKYAIFLLPIVVGAVDLVRAPLEKRLRWRWAFGWALVVLSTAALVWWGIGWPQEEPLTIARFEEIQAHSRGYVRALEHESWSDYGRLALVAFGWVPWALGALGILASLRTWRRDLGAISWLLVFGGFVVFGVGHNKARYLLPLAPALVYLAVAGLRLVSRTPRTVGAIACTSLLALATPPAVDQARLDAQAFFYEPVQGEALRFLELHRSEEGRVFWSGYFLALAPPRTLDLEEDEYLDVFHVGHPATSFHLATPTVGAPPGIAGPRWLRRHGRPGDVFVGGPRQFHSMTTVRAGEADAVFTVSAYARERLRHRDGRYVDEAGEARLELEGERLRPLEDLGNVRIRVFLPGTDTKVAETERALWRGVPVSLEELRFARFGTGSDAPPDLELEWFPSHVYPAAR